MKKQNPVNGQVKGLQNITRLGAILMTVSFAATSAQAVSASRTVTVGNAVFGATANVGFNDSAIGPRYRATTVARADGKVLSRNLALASGASSLEIQPQSNCRAYGSLKLGGLTMAAWNKSFSGSTNFNTAIFVKTLVGGNTRIWLGPVPVTLKASAKTRIHAKGRANVSASPIPGLRVVRASFGPGMDATATVAGGVTLLFAGVNVSGSLNLVDLDLTADISYTNQIGRNPFVAYRATTDLYSTDGAIKACAWVDPPLLPRIEWCKTLYEFHGVRSAFVLASGSRQL